MVAPRLKSVKVSDDIRADDDLRLVVDRANEILAEEIVKSAGTADAVWTLESDRAGHKRVRLSLSDFSGTVSAEFAPDELTAESRVRRRAIPLWGDLLQVRSHYQMQKLNELVED